MINLFLITNQADVATFAAGHGVSHIFVDLEVNGKYARQGHRDTLISKHSIEDINSIRTALNLANRKNKHQTELLVRINPLNEHSEKEIDAVIAHGADWIMLPMYRTTEEVQVFCDYVGGRARCIPLVETIGAHDCLADVCALPTVDMLFIGLNDLHMEMQRIFMFELLADGTIEKMADIIKDSGKPFGFGGIARIGEGMVSAEQILGEHLRLHSSAAILSRTFHRNSLSLHELHDNLDFGYELDKLRTAELLIQNWTNEQFQQNQLALIEATQQVVAKMKESREKNL